PPLFTSLKNGMQCLTETLASRLTASFLQTRTPVQAIQPEAGGWVVSAGLQSDHFDGVIVALPGPAAANVLGMASAELSGELRAIQYSSSITVGLGYDRDVRKSLPPGFGFLVPRSEGKRLLAATFVHNKFPHRAAAERALIRCFLGGARDPAILDQSDDEVLRVVRQELRQILNLTAEPLFA